MLFTGRMDMTVAFPWFPVVAARCPRPAHRVVALRGSNGRPVADLLLRQAIDQREEAVEEAAEKLAGRLVGELALLVQQLRLEQDVGFAAGQRDALRAEDLAQMLLGQRRADGAAGGAGDGRDLAGPAVLAPRPRAPVDRILQDGGDRTAVLRRDEQDAVGRRDRRLEALHAVG